MKRPASVLGPPIVLVLLSILTTCATPAARNIDIASATSPGTPSPPAGKSPVPRSSATLQPTWTPVSSASPRPTSTPGEVPVRTVSPTPTLLPWLSELIPPITLTATRTGTVPAESAAYYTDAAIAYAGGDLSAALEHLDRALALAPDHCDFLTMRAQVLIDLERPLDAAADLHHALGIDPFHAQARKSLAELLIDYGRFRSATAEYNRYLTLKPDDADGWYALGQLLEHQDQLLEAISAYSQTLELEPNHIEGFSRRGALWKGQEYHEAAWSDYTALLALAPSAGTYFERAEINLLLDAPLMAAADLKAGLALQPPGAPSYDILMRMGQAYLEGGDPLQATEAFSQSIGLTSSVEPYLWLADSHLASGDYAAAAAVVGEVLPLISIRERGRALAARGRAYAGLENYEAALSDLTEALGFARNADEKAAILADRGVVRASLGQIEDAIIDLTAAYNLTADPRILYQRGMLWQRIGREQAAMADLRAFLELADRREIAPTLLEDAQLRLAELSGAATESPSP